MKTAQMGHKASVSVAKTPLWSQSATANHLCTEAESIILQVLERIKLYTVSRTDGRQWQVELKDQLKETAVFGYPVLSPLADPFFS